MQQIPIKTMKTIVRAVAAGETTTEALKGVSVDSELLDGFLRTPEGAPWSKLLNRARREGGPERQRRRAERERRERLKIDKARQYDALRLLFGGCPICAASDGIGGALPLSYASKPKARIFRTSPQSVTFRCSCGSQWTLTWKMIGKAISWHYDRIKEGWTLDQSTFEDAIESVQELIADGAPATAEPRPRSYTTKAEQRRAAGRAHLRRMAEAKAAASAPSEPT